MIGARLHAIGEVLRLDEIPIPTPALDEVLIAVAAAGICGSDLHIIDGENVLPEFPRVLGHEIAGTIAEVGSAVTGLAVGQRVCVDFLITCGNCRFCRIGRESLCLNRAGIGVQRDGGWADYIAVPARNVVAVPDEVSLDQAAIATDALATPYHAISKRAHVRPGHGVVVIGLGGLGINAIRLLKAFGANPVIGLDPEENSRHRALAAGADVTFDPRGAEYADWESDTRPDIRTVFDFVGFAATVSQACEVVGRGGRVVVVGHGPQPLRLPAGSSVSREELEVVGSYSFEREEIAELMNLLAAGQLDLSESITHRIDLAEINDGVRRLRTRDGSPSRIVVRPSAAAE